MQESYVYKKEVDWSLLTDGLTIPVENQVVFARNMGKFLGKGEKKEITLVLMGHSYKARIVNVNFNQSKYKRKDIYQIRYCKGSELAVALRNIFAKSYRYFLTQRALRDKKGGSMIKLPTDSKEYLAIYTTEYEDTYLLETIVAEELYDFNNIIASQEEQVFENSVNYNIVDETSNLLLDERVVKIRKLNRAINENLKLLYEYRCQICGEVIGSRYDVHIVEAHHIDYYVKSMNNDSNNQLIVCPNHHRIIHNANPVFDRGKKIYVYSNGLVEGLALNYHI